MLKGNLITLSKQRWNIEKDIWKVNEFNFLNEEVEESTTNGVKTSLT